MEETMMDKKIQKNRSDLFNCADYIKHNMLDL